MAIFALGTFLSTHGPLHQAKPKNLEESCRSYVSEVNSVGCMFMSMIIPILPMSCYLVAHVVCGLVWCATSLAVFGGQRSRCRMQDVDSGFLRKIFCETFGPK